MFRLIAIILILNLVPTVIAVASGEAEKVGDINIDATVKESIGHPVTILVSMFPGETKQKDVLISNKASVNSGVTLYLDIEPEGQGVTATIKKDFVVPAEGSINQVLTVKARNNSVADTYKITIGVFRSK